MNSHCPIEICRVFSGWLILLCTAVFSTLLFFQNQHRTDLSLAELIYHGISYSAGFDGGTEDTIFARLIFCIFVIVKSII